MYPYYQIPAILSESTLKQIKGTVYPIYDDLSHMIDRY